MDAPPSSSGDGDIAPLSQSYQPTWIREEDLLRRKLVLGDDFSWALDSCDGGAGGEPLRYVGGVDVSFSKDDPSLACGALVVVDLQQLQRPPQQQQRGREAAVGVVHEAFELVRLRVPYIPGFLAFREAPILLRLLEKTKRDALHFYPQLLMVDGNGILHPRGKFLHLHHVDGLTLSRVRQLLQDPANASKNVFTLTGDSDQLWGAAIRSSPGSLKPIFVSVGHRIALESCIKVVKMCCKYRVPEPIRQADMKSRQHLHTMQGIAPQGTYEKRMRHRGETLPSISVLSWSSEMGMSRQKDRSFINGLVDGVSGT
ncbi:hypothetical protein Taro_018966, partial [Colocasia esculenta]|nr:hypothetical protein [Colocasia esculenta]